MPAHLSAICFIETFTENPTKNNFVVTAVGTINSKNQEEKTYLHITAFYPLDESKHYDLQKFGKKDIIALEGRFFMEDDKEEEKRKNIKVLASSITVLNMDEEDLPPMHFSVVLLGFAAERPEINSIQATVKMNVKEYLTPRDTGIMDFHLYHFAEEAHLLPITKKINRGAPLYVTGHLTFVQGLALIKIAQINFAESMSTSNNSSTRAWEQRRQNPNVPPPALEIANTIIENAGRKRKNKSEPGTNTAKLPRTPKLASIALNRTETPTTEEEPEESTSQTESMMENVVV